MQRQHVMMAAASISENFCLLSGARKEPHRQKEFRMAEKFYNADGDKNHLYFFCPGCGCDHYIKLSVWSFDGNMESPTVTPSIRVFYPATENNPEKTICHFYINHGQIQYLNDCVHRLAGQSVGMKDVD